MSKSFTLNNAHLLFLWPQNTKTVLLWILQKLDSGTCFLSQWGGQVRTPFYQQLLWFLQKMLHRLYNHVVTYPQGIICDPGFTAACPLAAFLVCLLSASVRAVSYYYDLMASQFFQTCQNFLEYTQRKQSLCFLLVGPHLQRLCQSWNQWVILADQRGDFSGGRGYGRPQAPFLEKASSQMQITDVGWPKA